MLKKAFWNAAASGVMIGIGGTVFLACDDRYIGAVLFTVALLSICAMGLYLYTGKVGYMAVNHDKSDFAVLGMTLLGNLLGTLFSGLAVGYMNSGYMETAAAMCAKKLALAAPQVLIAGLFCGILMYTAVEIYRAKSSCVGILFCVPVFIIAGFEHSIADMFYFFCSRIFTGEAAVFLMLVIIGNSVGGMLIPALKLLAGEKSYEN